MVSFSSCSGDDPVADRDEQNDNKDDSEFPPEGTVESTYKPRFTENKIKELIIEDIKRDPQKPSWTESYFYHNVFTYDDSERICEHKRFRETDDASIEAVIYTEEIAYIGDTIKCTYSDGSGVDNNVLLNTEGYVRETNSHNQFYKYDEGGYLVEYYMAGYGDNGYCTLIYDNGNLIRESKPVGSYVCTYTQYLNNTSLDLNYYLVRDEGHVNISVPTDIFGKRSNNLPKKRSVGETIWTTYSYEFDFKGRVVKITSIHESNFSKYPDTIIYHIKYID